MTQTPELKACPNPWCASHDRRDPELFELHKPIAMDHADHPDKWVISCPVCPISGPPTDTASEAAALWNTRPLEADNAVLKAKNEALVEALAKRDAKADACPIDKPHCSDADRAKCSRCGATAFEGCHVKAMADYTFTQEARAALAGAQ